MTDTVQFNTSVGLIKRSRRLGFEIEIATANKFITLKHPRLPKRDNWADVTFLTIEEALAFLEGWEMALKAVKSEKLARPNWRAVLGFHSHEEVTPEEINERYRDKARQADSEQVLLELNLCRDSALQELGG